MNANDTAAGPGTGTPALGLVENTAQDRFELRVGDELIGILGYAVETPGESAATAGAGTQVAFMHTVIMEDHWRRGLAAELVEFAMTAARDRGWRVRPVCTYVQRFLVKNPDFQHITV
ncbi:GNAT family N-acetyltransferase [Tomitella gaofuii]|uniref:GNAT family N-acetyltransferase n=1 Tax=Tomitella gaofuii TaxID=2760083 RepID=UPI0015F7E3B7|nr:GNAT family N-acetyltransferase [Tomitella gaofuii]